MKKLIITELETQELEEFKLLSSACIVIGKTTNATKYQYHSKVLK